MLTDEALTHYQTDSHCLQERSDISDNALDAKPRRSNYQEPLISAVAWIGACLEKTERQMKKIITALLGALGAGSADEAQAPAKVVDVPTDSILFSMPTISMDDIEFEIPTASTVEGALQFHEDDWRQLEFFPSTRLVEVQAALEELKSFEATHRAQHGWTQIYVREITRAAIGVSVADIEHALHANTRPAPILTSFSHPLGQVKHGFSLEFGKNAYLYGVREREQVTVLGVSLQGADNMLLSNAFSKLNKKFGLILVDWAQQFVLVDIDDSGQFDAWRP